MNTTTNFVTPTLRPGTLATLRSLAFDTPDSMKDMLRASNDQARLLQDLLPASIDELPTHLTRLIPTILIESAADLPVPGLFFWANNHWHIHVCASDPVDTQAKAILHQLKHIIDYPLQQSSGLGHADWEVLADQFAAHVLAHASRVATMQRKEVFL
jgi:hypothetical protein